MAKRAAWMTVMSALSCSNSLLSNSKHKKHGRKAVRLACAGGIWRRFRGSILFSLALERISICRLPVRAVAWRARPLGVVCTAASACRERHTQLLDDRRVVRSWVMPRHSQRAGRQSKKCARSQKPSSSRSHGPHQANSPHVHRWQGDIRLHSSLP